MENDVSFCVKQCSAKKRNGARCTLPAKKDGLCHIHLRSKRLDRILLPEPTSLYQYQKKNIIHIDDVADQVTTAVLSGDIEQVATLLNSTVLPYLSGYQLLRSSLDDPNMTRFLLRYFANTVTHRQWSMLLAESHNDTVTEYLQSAQVVAEK